MFVRVCACVCVVCVLCGVAKELMLVGSFVEIVLNFPLKSSARVRTDIFADTHTNTRKHTHKHTQVHIVHNAHATGHLPLHLQQRVCCVIRTWQR